MTKYENEFFFSMESTTKTSKQEKNPPAQHISPVPRERGIVPSKSLKHLKMSRHWQKPENGNRLLLSHAETYEPM